MKAQLWLLQDLSERVWLAITFQLRTMWWFRGDYEKGMCMWTAGAYILKVTGIFRSLSLAKVKSSRLSLSIVILYGNFVLACK